MNELQSTIRIQPSETCGIPLLFQLHGYEVPHAPTFHFHPNTL